MVDIAGNLVSQTLQTSSPDPHRAKSPYIRRFFHGFPTVTIACWYPQDQTGRTSREAVRTEVATSVPDPPGFFSVSEFSVPIVACTASPGCVVRWDAALSANAAWTTSRAVVGQRPALRARTAGAHIDGVAAGKCRNQHVPFTGSATCARLRLLRAESCQGQRTLQSGATRCEVLQPVSGIGWQAIEGS